MSQNTQEYDVIVVGGGAAGLMCALTVGQRGQRGQRVLVLEKTNKPGKKILMSGGGRCNFTNLHISPDNFICANAHFVKSALKQYTQWDFIELVKRYDIAYHEKSHGQLFCDKSAKDILNMLLAECEQGNVEIQLNCNIDQLDRGAELYSVKTNKGSFVAPNVVIACGGLSIPTLGGATGYGYQLAKQFGLKVYEMHASLVPMTLTGRWHEWAKLLSGVAVAVNVSVPKREFSEQMLFTHRGLSGPAILQLSNYWTLGEVITINLLPSIDLLELLKTTKQLKPNALLRNILIQWLPKSLVQLLQEEWWPDKAESPLQQFRNTDLQAIVEKLTTWQVRPSGTEGYRTAEVTMGGVDTDVVSSKTMAVKGISGLYFIGEVLDVTGHLGGFNFQWAWSSAYVAGVDITT